MQPIEDDIVGTAEKIKELKRYLEHIKDLRIEFSHGYSDPPEIDISVRNLTNDDKKSLLAHLKQALDGWCTVKLTEIREELECTVVPWVKIQKGCSHDTAHT